MDATAPAAIRILRWDGVKLTVDDASAPFQPVTRTGLALEILDLVLGVRKLDAAAVAEASAMIVAFADEVLDHMLSPWAMTDDAVRTWAEAWKGSRQA